MRLVQTFTYASLLVYPFIAFAAGDDTVFRTELKPVGILSPDDPLLHVKAFVECETAQPHVEEGIEILLDIFNEGPEAVELISPIGSMTVSVRNADGAKVSLPNVKPEWSFCGPWNADAARLAAMRARMDARRGFQVEIESQSHRAALVRPSARKLDAPPKVELGPGEHFRATIRVTQVLGKTAGYWTEVRQVKDQRRRLRKEGAADDASAIAMPPPPEIAPIPPGIYTLRLTVILMGPPNIDPPMPRMRFLRLPVGEAVTVRLGPEE